MRETDGTDRRTFLKGAGGLVMTTGMDARSYARILGANDRIRLGQLGCGDRSAGHVRMAQLAAKQIPVETVAVCDLWNRARERRAAQVRKAFSLGPQIYQYSEDMLARKDIDGVMIATGDFQHAKLCCDVVRAGKDCYVEKPFANVLAEAKEAREIVKASSRSFRWERSTVASLIRSQCVTSFGRGRSATSYPSNRSGMSMRSAGVL